jgi:hypothetical protein
MQKVNAFNPMCGVCEMPSSAFPEFLRPNRGWFLGLAGMVAAYIIDRLDAPLWLAILTLLVLLVAAVLHPWSEKSKGRRATFWFILCLYALFAIAAVYSLRASDTRQAGVPPNIILKGTGPFATGAVLALPQGVFSVNIDTTILDSVANRFNLMVILRVRDDTIDALTDGRIIKSSAFAITHEVRPIQINLPPDFVERARGTKKLFGEVEVDVYLGAVPKNIKPEQILTVNDITMLGGRQMIIDPKPLMRILE